MNPVKFLRLQGTNIPKLPNESRDANNLLAYKNGKEGKLYFSLLMNVISLPAYSQKLGMSIL